MDLWIVAAAAAAGYLSKYCQNLSRDKGSLSELSSGDSNFENPASPSSPFGKCLRRKKLVTDVSTDRSKLSDYHLDGAEAVEAASTTEFDNGNSGNYGDSNLLSISSLPSVFSTNEILNEVVSGGNVDEYSGKSSASETDYVRGYARNKSSLKTRCSYRHFVKPLSSLESCLVAQLYNEKARMEDYVLSSLPLPSSPTTRPLLVTDGSHIIGRGNKNSFNGQLGPKKNELHKESCLEKNEMVFGVSLPPKLGLLDLPNKLKLKSGKGRSVGLGSSTKVVNGKQFQSQDGSQNGAVLFCIGISIGLISSFIANKREVDKLKELLKQTENLVQDLQDELEMKDSLTVKELVNENYESQHTVDSPFQARVPNSFAAGQNMDASTRYDGKESLNQKAGSSDCMSKIEAELETELERLGLNIHTSTLDGRLTELEIDQCFVEDFAQGEFRTDIVRGQAALLHESNQDSSGASTTHYGNYAVSPLEVSLRLHEVINSRLEERVRELETALQNSEKKLKLIESERKIKWQTFSNSDQRYSCTLESPTAEDCNSSAQPLVMNLSGEALDAYNEAYEELLKVNDSDEEDSPVHAHPFIRSLSYGQDNRIDCSSAHLKPNEDKKTETLFMSHSRLEDTSSRIQELLDVGMSGDESSDCDGDELEKELIKQIVERTKKGSPAVMNAQRALFLMDESEH